MKQKDKVKTTIRIIGVLMMLLPYTFVSGNSGQQEVSKSGKTVTKSTQAKTTSKQTTTKTGQTKSTAKQKTTKPAASKSAKPVPIAEPAKTVPDPSVVLIGSLKWAVANLNVSTFRNGDTITEAKSNNDWVAAGVAGKPAWCYYNNDPALGKKYGKLYNWYAVNDPRELAPAGWTLTSDDDWAVIANSLGGPGAAGTKMKSATGWTDGNNGTNESGFTGLPGGYRVENGLFRNLGSIGIWWSTTESRNLSAYDHYLLLSGSLDRSSNPKQRGESVRCIKK